MVRLSDILKTYKYKAFPKRDNFPAKVRAGISPPFYVSYRSVINSFRLQMDRTYQVPVHRGGAGK